MGWGTGTNAAKKAIPPRVVPTAVRWQVLEDKLNEQQRALIADAKDFIRGKKKATEKNRDQIDRSLTALASYACTHIDNISERNAFYDELNTQLAKLRDEVFKRTGMDCAPLHLKVNADRAIQGFCAKFMDTPQGTEIMNAALMLNTPLVVNVIKQRFPGLIRDNDLFQEAVNVGLWGHSLKSGEKPQSAYDDTQEETRLEKLQRATSGLSSTSLAAAFIKWNPAQSKLATYATYSVRSAVGRYAETQREMWQRTEQREDEYEIEPKEVMRLSKDRDPLDEAIDAEQREQLREWLDCLPARERAVIEMRFGMFEPCGHSYTLKQVGERLGLTRERARQIEAAALVKLQDAASGMPLSPVTEKVAVASVKPAVAEGRQIA